MTQRRAADSGPLLQFGRSNRSIATGLFFRSCMERSEQWHFLVPHCSFALARTRGEQKREQTIAPIPLRNQLVALC
jgi:hypothetical protein